jgi:hemerythrin
MLEWDEKLSIGVAEVDAQHKQLLALVNDTRAAAERGGGAEAAGQALHRLCDYVVEHFAAEEALMDPEAYPEYARHMTEHMECTTLALDFLQSFDQGSEVNIVEFLDFATKWVAEHIMQTDQTLGRYLAGRG